MPSLRFIAVTLLASSSMLGSDALAKPLDKEACLNLEVARKRLLTREMQRALDHGPDWVKNHLNTGEIEKVREFLEIEEMLEFRCDGQDAVSRALQSAARNPDGVPMPDRKPDPPKSEIAENDASEVPLPDRNPAAAQSTMASAKPSQAVADSDKTAPVEAKATR